MTMTTEGLFQEGIKEFQSVSISFAYMFYYVYNFGMMKHRKLGSHPLKR